MNKWNHNKIFLTVLAIKGMKIRVSFEYCMTKAKAISEKDTFEKISHSCSMKQNK
jgi:hypothetical protein